MFITIEPQGVSSYWEKHPTYEKAKANQDCGLDIPMSSCVIVPGKECAFTIRLGIKTQPDHAYMIIPRSSLAKTPLRLANSIGIIDKSYRGELMAKVDNISKNSFTLEEGKCYFQIVAFDGNLPRFHLGEVNDTVRGSGGFGSTTT
jgi:dUTP pyrophosphatase